MKRIIIIILCFLLYPFYVEAETVYDAIYEVFNNRRVYLQNGHYGYLDDEGKELCPPIYDKIQPFRNGVSLVRKNGLWGCVNYDLDEVIPCEFNILEYASKNKPRYLGKKNNRWGMVDNNNNVMLDFIYDEIRGEKNGTIILISNENYGLADLDGNIIIIPQWLWMDNMFDGWALIYYEIERSSSDYAYSFIDSKGHIMEHEFEYASSYSNGISVVLDFQQEEEYLINTEGERLTYNWEGYAPKSSEELIGVYKDGEWGFISTITGEEIIAPSWDEVEIFSTDGLAAVRKGDLWGYINKLGELVIDTKWDLACDFYNGYAVVSDGEKEGVIDINGRVCVPLVWNEITCCSEGYFAVKNSHGLWGFINTEGTLVIPCHRRVLESDGKEVRDESV